MLIVNLLSLLACCCLSFEIKITPLVMLVAEEMAAPGASSMPT